jgi:hypothetical protein
MDVETSNGKRKAEVQTIFLNPFTICSFCRFVVCPFVDEDTNGSYPFANGLNRLYRLNGLNVLNGLALLLQSLAILFTDSE